VDPLAEKSPNVSSYVYCFDNPVKYEDPNGEIPFPVYDKFRGESFRIDSYFGPRNTGLSYASKYHKGLDINFGSGNFDYGAPVLTTHDGKVTSVEKLDGENGRNVTVVSTDGKFRTRYLHLKQINVKDGQSVSEGDQVGEIGGSRNGEEIGGQVHLHYQIDKYNPETKKWEPYNPTEGKENKKENVVDPQKWITNNQKTKHNKPNIFRRILDSGIKNVPKQNK